MALVNASARTIPGMVFPPLSRRDHSTEPTGQSPALLGSGGGVFCPRWAAGTFDDRGQFDDASRQKDRLDSRCSGRSDILRLGNSASGHGAERCSLRWFDRLRGLPARPQRFLDRAAPTTITPQGVQLNLAPGQTFPKNQFVSGIEVTTVLDRNCGNQ